MALIEQKPDSDWAEIGELLSAMVDDEARPGEQERAFARLRTEADLKAVWSRYHLIGDVIHGNSGEYLQVDISTRVMAQLADEPTLLAPRPGRSWVKPLAGLAVAASVTGVAIMMVQESDTPHGVNPPPVATVERSDFIRITPPATPVSAVASRSSKRDPRLDPYLVNHNEYAAVANKPGGLPYIVLVGQKGK